MVYKVRDKSNTSKVDYTDELIEMTMRLQQGTPGILMSLQYHSAINVFLGSLQVSVLGIIE